MSREHDGVNILIQLMYAKYFGAGGYVMTPSALKVMAEITPSLLYKKQDGYLPWHIAAYNGDEELMRLFHPSLKEQTIQDGMKINPEANININADKQALHFIWLGGPLPKKYRNNIEGFSQIAAQSGYKINLWIEDEKIIEPINGVNIRRISELNEGKKLNHSDGGKTFDRALSMEIGLKNWASASDILRLEIIRQKGGLYLDTDQQPNLSKQDETAGLFKQPNIFPQFDDLIQEKDKVYLHQEIKIIDGEKQKASWKNDILAANAGNRSLMEYEQWVLRNYEEYFSLIDSKNPDVFSSIIHIKNKSEKNSLDNIALTVFTTSFNKAVSNKENYRFIYTDQVPFDPIHLEAEHHSDMSWAKKVTASKTSIDALDLAVKDTKFLTEHHSDMPSKKRTLPKTSIDALDLAVKDPKFPKVGYWQQKASSQRNNEPML